MPIELEAAGDALTGAIIGRAVEPDHGEGNAAAHGACLNCGAALIGAHCHSCGQKARVHRTLHAYSNDLLHSVFHFEGKIWRTLPMLAFKPGDLTRRYIHGERAKFVSPLALFLFSVFLMFAVVSSLAGEAHMPTDEIKAGLKGKALPEVEAGLKSEQAKLADIEAQIKKAEAADGPTEALEQKTKEIESDINGLEQAQSALKGKKWTVTEAKTGWPLLDAKIKAANDNPNLFLYKIQSSAYKYSWALIPLSVPFVWLLFFWRRQFKVYDHAVFVTYSLTFMLFLTVVLTALGFAGAPQPVVPIAGTFVPPIHMYRQLRGTYGVSRLGGIFRTLLLSTFAGAVLMVFLMLLLLLGIMG